MSCPFEPEYVEQFIGLIPKQIGIFFVFVALYCLARYKQVIVKVPAERFFRFKFDSLKDTLLMPLGAGVILSFGFLALRPIFAPAEPDPPALALSLLAISSLFLAPLLESIAVQGLVFLIVLSAYLAIQNKKGGNYTVFEPSNKALITALLVQGIVFGVAHFNDFTRFFAFKTLYTAIDGFVLGYLCWTNGRNLLPPTVCHFAYNFTAILFQPYLLC